MEIKEVRVSSKRTEHIKVGTTVDTFVSFETEYTATLDKEDNVKDATKELYDRANSQIDEQVEEFVNLCYNNTTYDDKESEEEKEGEEVMNMTPDTAYKVTKGNTDGSNKGE